MKRYTQVAVVVAEDGTLYLVPARKQDDDLHILARAALIHRNGMKHVALRVDAAEWEGAGQ